jgi:hypothetical protein
MPLFGREYAKITLNDIERYLGDADLTIVGGLIKRGWTVHDIDVIGKREDIPAFAERLRNAGFPNAIHFCGERNHHSHVQCVFFGVKLALTGKGY